MIGIKRMKSHSANLSVSLRRGKVKVVDSSSSRCIRLRHGSKRKPSDRFKSSPTIEESQSAGSNKISQTGSLMTSPCIRKTSELVPILQRNSLSDPLRTLVSLPWSKIAVLQASGHHNNSSTKIEINRASLTE